MARKPFLLLIFALVLFAGAFVAESGFKSDHQGHLSQIPKGVKEYGRLKGQAYDFAKDNLRAFAKGVTPVAKSSNGISGLVFYKDSLVWWSDQGVLLSPNDTASGLRFVQNGWYLVQKETSGPWLSMSLLKVKQQYPFTNRYLTNDLNPAFKLCSYWDLAKSTDPGNLTIDEKDGFYVKPSSDGSEPFLLPSWLLLAGSVFLMAAIGRFLRQRGFAWNAAAGLAFLAIYLFRILTGDLLEQLPLWNWGFFRPDQYASSWLLNAPADLFLVSCVLFFLNKGIAEKSFSYFLKLDFRVGVTLLSALNFCCAFFCAVLIKGLILDSRIPFDFDRVFALDAYSFFGFVIIGMLVATALNFSKSAATALSNHSFIKPQHRLLMFIVPLVMLTISFFSGMVDVTLVIFGLAAMTWGMLEQRLFPSRPQGGAYSAYLAIIAGISLLSALHVFEWDTVREQESRKVWASRLERERDRVAEFLFEDVLRGVRDDATLSGLFSQPYERMTANVSVADSIERRLMRNHLSGYWDRYDIAVRSFNADGLPVNAGGDPTWSLDMYDQRLREAGNDSSHFGLFFTGGSEGRMNYTGKAGIYHTDTLVGIVVVSLSSKPLSERSGFPELLLSGSVPQSRNVADYAVAYYRNDTLVNKSGDFAYPILAFSEFIEASRLEGDFIRLYGYSHLVQFTSDHSFLVVSHPISGAYKFFTAFSYLFAIYGMLFLLIYAGWFFYRNGWRWKPNLGARIRISVVLIVVLTMLITGGATVYYIFNTYQADGGPETENRINTLVDALQEEIGKRYDGGSMSGGDEMNSSLAGLAKGMGADFNLFDRGGMLLYSSQPKLYDQQIIAPLMNPMVLDQMKKQPLSTVSIRERIGGFEYLSTFVPMMQEGYGVKGYLNVSYFSQQAEFEERISGFLVAVVNLYVLLFALASFFTFFLSSRITQPLQLIREKLSAITFNQRNELLEWNSEDEIGDLVKEYNRMATELSGAAEQLAKSEREFAWREMAKQVAHEIKNPLTPMKLGLQHLQRAWRENHPDKEKIMERMTQVLIEQIDTLSHIATEFSGFAQMPTAHVTQFDLDQVLQSVADLYAEHDSVKVRFNSLDGTPHLITADRDQMMRVFSNLVKNGVQATEEVAQGTVDIEIWHKDGKVEIRVRDNGKGIPEALKSRIFTPNFTTKSGGTGLGLAICKQIVEQFGGTITFESKVPGGTVFLVRI